MENIVQRLHEKAVQIAKNYLQSEYDLIDIFKQIDQCRAYRQLGYKSLFEYGTKALSLSESVTYCLITVSRKVREVPMLQEKLKSREITLTNARKIVPVLTSENQEKWLKAAAQLSKRDLEKSIATANPKLAVKESVRYVTGDRLELKMGISEALHHRLMRAQELVSSKLQKAAKLEDTLEILVQTYLEREDPLQKAERAEARASKGKESEPMESASRQNSTRRYIPAQLIHQVNLRDGNQCAQTGPDGLRCQERKWLDTHHIVPLSMGGKNELKNLTTLCRAHHQMTHARGSQGPPSTQSTRAH